MPELPEVETTVRGLNTETTGFEIIDVWTDYNSKFHAEKDNIKNPAYFKTFRQRIVGAKIIKTTRRAKNILIHLSNKSTVLIHMKMTGHIMCGDYTFHKKEVRDPWKATNKDPKNPLNDPFNRFIHLVFTLQRNKSTKHLVLSDMRKFAKVTLLPTDEIAYHEEKHAELSHLGPEPLDKNFTYTIFENQLNKRLNTPIKQALMDQTLIAGIGNIYSDEILWRSAVHPESTFAHIPFKIRKIMFMSTKKILAQGIDFGGDSMSDYRNIYGLRGEFQGQHKAYRKTGHLCSKKGCTGKIERKVIGGRSAHFCKVHQVLYR